MSRFAASQSVELALPGSLATLQTYLAEPQRLVYALFDPGRVEERGDDIFRLQMQALSFFMLKIQPTVDLRVWTDSRSVVHIEAIDCQISGVDAINRQFTLALTGELYPVAQQGGIPLSGDNAVSGVNTETSRLVGRADLEVQVDLPSTFAIISTGIVRKAGNKLLSSVLATIEGRLVRHLREDYSQWSAAHAAQTTVPQHR